jgi:phosphatidylserine decarboxylase
MSTPTPLTVFDRRSGQTFQEFMEDSPATYESHPSEASDQWLKAHPLYDWLAAAWQNTPWSAGKIEPFVSKHRIDMSEFEPGPFRSYAAFFDRRFLPGMRNFPANNGEMGAFGEGRYFGWEKLEPGMSFPVKGAALSPQAILGSEERVAQFDGGPVILARLSPVDYHHLHYPDDGHLVDETRIGYRLWTVNPTALRNQPDILFRNERYIQLLRMEHFGLLGFVEVGALSVGRITQVHRKDAPFRRGEEKSVFKFGGSAVVLFGQKQAWRPADDILQHTREGMETYLRLGEVIAERTRDSEVGHSESWSG